MKKLLAVTLALILLSSAALADSSIFVATDRHHHYETLTVEEPAEAQDAEARPEADPPPDGEAPPEGPKRPRKKQYPVYDEDGSLIWHNDLTAILRLAAEDGAAPEFVLLGGDNVGEGSDRSRDETGYPMGAPFFSMTAIDAQVRAVFGDGPRTLYTYGSHDINATDRYEDVFFSGPVAGNGYYIYGITFSQMIHDTDRQAEKYEGKDAADPRGLSAQTASHLFLSWVRSLDDHLPIVVMSHVPLHAHRGDNLGAWTWTKALNAAAEDHDVIFLWGHNHTTEAKEEDKQLERAHYLLLPGDRLTAQTWEPDAEGKAVGSRTRLSEDEKEVREPVAQMETLRFLYMNAGYITNGVGTLITFEDGRIRVKRYALKEEEQAEPFEYELYWKE